MHVRVLGVLLVLWLSLGSAPLFGNPLSGNSLAGNPLTGRATAPDEAAATMALLPEPLRGMAQRLNRIQADFSRRMTGQLRETRDQEGSVAAGAWLCLIAFVYGVLHAAGPGHGKLVVSSYFLSGGAPVRRGLLLAGGVALTQALAAILLVGVPLLVLDWTRASVLGGVRVLELVSYGLMTAVGLLLLVRAVRGDGCGHAHHGRHGHACAPHGLPRLAPDRAGFSLLTLAVGCRPCSGAVLVLLFALANAMVPAGLLAVLAMAGGVALTTAAAGLVGIGARHRLDVALLTHPRAARLAGRGLAVAGALLIVAVGGLLFFPPLAGFDG